MKVGVVKLLSEILVPAKARSPNLLRNQLLATFFTKAYSNFPPRSSAALLFARANDGFGEVFFQFG